MKAQTKIPCVSFSFSTFTFKAHKNKVKVFKVWAIQSNSELPNTSYSLDK